MEEGRYMSRQLVVADQHGSSAVATTKEIRHMQPLLILHYTCMMHGTIHRSAKRAQMLMTTPTGTGRTRHQALKNVSPVFEGYTAYERSDDSAFTV